MTDDNGLDDLPPSPKDDATRTRLDHEVYLKAVNNPVRRRLLEIISKAPLSSDALAEQLVQEGLLRNKGTLNYHLDVLGKAKCVVLDRDPKGNIKAIKITQGGQVVDYMEK
jgi:DNA-binding transcriptional ArsR family regulator